MNIEQQIKWLEQCRNKSGELFNKRLSQVQRQINHLEHFVDLKVNESIQSYWHPIFSGWRERLAGLYRS